MSFTIEFEDGTRETNIQILGDVSIMYKPFISHVAWSRLSDGDTVTLNFDPDVLYNENYSHLKENGITETDIFNNIQAKSKFTNIMMYVRNNITHIEVECDGNNVNLSLCPPKVTYLELIDFSNDSLAGCPDHITKLNITIGSNLKSLGGCPAGLEQLNLFNCKKLVSLRDIPDTLYKLRIQQCPSLPIKPGMFPKHLKILDTSGFYNKLNTLSMSDIPVSLDTLNFNGSAFTSLEGCPKTLKRLDLSDCQYLESLKGCPEGLEYLNIEGSISLKSLDGISKRLKHLEIGGFNESVYDTTYTPHLPYPINVDKITLHYETHISVIPKNIKNIKSIELYECEYWDDFVGFPKTITSINTMGGCTMLDSLAGLRIGLTDLTVNNCMIRSLIGLPSTLKELNVSDCGELTSLVGCPPDVTKLRIQNCGGLTTLKGCPICIEELDIRGCASLKSLDHVPRHVRVITN
jgi:hypothetical protein